MGHYAKVINGLVVDVNVATQEWVNSQSDKELWYETSINVTGGVYYYPETNTPHEQQELIIKESKGRQRKNYAGVGYQYDEELDAFIPPSPFRSWVFNETTCLWDPPVPYPQDFGTKLYLWNERQKEWTYTGYYFEDGELIKDEDIE